MNRASFNPLDMTGRRYLVTGASSGIGRSTAILLSRLGSQVVLVGRNKEELIKTESQMDGDHVIADFDLTRSLSDVQSWLSEVVTEGGKLNGIAHCAGKHFPLPLKAMSDSTIGEALKINIHAAINLAFAFRKKGIAAGEGRSVVFLASVMSVVGQPSSTLYAATKGGVASLTKSLALEWVSENIRVNCISPACVNTEMTQSLLEKMTNSQIDDIKKQHPMGFGEPDDVANMIAFLLADTAKWITGANFFVDGGYTAQ